MLKIRQLELLDQQEVEPLWERFTEQARMEVTQHYARLMSRASVQRIAALKNHREADDEPSD
mgnify:CR=1 FL=1|jgi:hypothetical protein